MKTIVQPKPLSAILADIPAVIPNIEVDMGMPAIKVEIDGEKKEGSDTSSLTGMELGASGMLQVGGLMTPDSQDAA